MANSTTRRFSTGSTPGMPRQTGQMLLVRRRAEARRAAAEDLRLGQQLGVHLEADDGLEAPGVRRAAGVALVTGHPGQFRRPAAMPVGRLLVGVRCAQHDLLVERPADDLQADRQAGAVDAARQRRSPGRPARFTEMVKMSERYICERIVDLLAEAERGGRRDRRDDRVAALEDALEVAPDERPHLLRLQVVGVVVAGRERVGPEHDAALHLGAEARGARLPVHLEQAAAGGRRAVP